MPPSLQLYNSYSKKEETFLPSEEGIVRIYTCGPTVYGRPHIGNYSSFLMADLLRRWLEVSAGYKVAHVKNITDVGHLAEDRDEGEDKVEKQAREERIDPLAIARKYEEQYLEDEATLRMLEPAYRPRATETIVEMLEMIKALIASGHAYETEDGIYFSIASFPQYGGLSGNKVEDIEAGARIAVKESKRHPADFALWKKCVGSNASHILRWSFETGERTSTSGEDPSAGFPGWHIECSAMSRKFLGDTIDIHTGGEDNIFPHHECEIAQSESVTGKQFVRFWLHKRRIDMGAEKMSKSLGNVLTVPDVLQKGYGGQDLRFYLLSVHYRTRLKFTWKGMDDAHKARMKIVEWMEEVREWKGGGKLTPDDVFPWREKFRVALDSDLNTPAALAAIFDLMTWARNHRDELSQEAIEYVREFIDDIRRTFGCFDAEEGTVPADVEALLTARDKAREEKNFAESDRLRDEIRALGFEVRDTDTGQVARKM